MNKAIGFAMFFLGVSFFTVLFISCLNFTAQIQKVNDYHYATVHEIESSDFAISVINERKSSNAKYTTNITEKSVKEDMRVYTVTTSTTLQIPILGFETAYLKESVAR